MVNSCIGLVRNGFGIFMDALMALMSLIILLYKNEIFVTSDSIKYNLSTLYRRFRFMRIKKETDFRISRHEIENDAFPECKDPNFIKSHPYINFIPYATPSIEYREFDDFMYSRKMANMSSRSAKEKHSIQEIVAQKRVFLKQIDMIMGKAPPQFNTVVDNIYLNKDIRFCVLQYGGCSVQNGIIMYVHGGGYLGGSHTFPLPMLTKLCQMTGCIAVSIDYRYPPEFPLPIAMNDTLKLYEWLCDYKKVRSDRSMFISSNCPDFLRNLPCDGSISKKIAICGDSAGGNITLSTLQRINAKKGLAMPCCSWVLSPKTFISAMKKNEVVRNGIRDAWLTTFFLKETWCNLGMIFVGNYKNWLKNEELKDKDECHDSMHGMFSPLNGDVKGLCPMFICCGATELVLDDTLKFSEKAFKAGVEVEVEIHPYLCHPYPIFVNVFPEAVFAVSRAAEFINRQFKKVKTDRKLL